MKCLVFDVKNNFVIYNLYVYMNSFLWKNKLNMDMLYLNEKVILVENIDL